MNKQEIQERIAAITNEMTLTKANYAKLEGHLGEAQHWLGSILKFESEQEEVQSGEVNNESAQGNTEE